MTERRKNNDNRFGESRETKTYYVERGLNDEFPDSFKLTFIGPLALRDARSAVSILRQYEPTAAWRIANKNEETVV